MFSRFSAKKTSFHFDEKSAASPKVVAGPAINIPTASGGQVDASCNTTITVTCLKQLYNAVGFTPSGKNGNKIGITGYLEQFANKQDLQSFFADQVPAALNSSFETISINGSFFPLVF